MSVTICWRPASDEGKHFREGTSSDLKALEDVFGSTITEKQVPTLRAMAVASKREFYNEVADIVEQVGSIDFWGAY